MAHRGTSSGTEKSKYEVETGFAVLRMPLEKTGLITNQNTK